MLILDEVQEFLETSGVDKERKAKAEEATRLLTSLVKRGRSAGLFVVMHSQKVDSSAIPTRLRDQCAIRLSGRQMTVEGSCAALGAVNDGDPAPHRDISANAPGRMIVSDVTDRAQLIQAFYAPPEVLVAAVGGGAPEREARRRERRRGGGSLLPTTQ